MKSVPLSTWARNYFNRQGVVGTPSAYQAVYDALRDAGYHEVTPEVDTFVTKIATAALARERAQPRAEPVRSAAVVSADGMCPHCGGPMVNATLTNGTPIRHCSKCRTSAYVVS